MRRTSRNNPPRKGPASPEGWKTGPHTGLYWHGVANPDIYADLIAGRRKLSLQTGWASDPGDLGWGIYLTSLRREAAMYGNVLKVRCVLRNALFVSNPRAWFEQMTEMTGGNPVRGSMRKLMAYVDAEKPYYGAELQADKKHYADLWTKLFLSKGIDGLVVKGWDLGGPVVVFEPETALSIVSAQAPARRNPRRNSAKVPAALLNRSALDAVGKAYPNQIRVPERNTDAAVLRDFMLDAGIETLPGMPAIERGSTLHRWIVWDAALSAESVPQKPMGRLAIHRAKSWVADPSPSIAITALDAAWRCLHESQSRAAIAAHYAAADTMSDSPYAPRDSAFNASLARRSPTSTAERAGDAANIRVRVLAALYAVDGLPEPPKLNPRS